MTTESLTGVWGVARRHRAGRNAGGPALREVATLALALRREQRWASEGPVVPSGLTGQRNRWGGKRPWFGVCLDESRGRRLA
jgi:hypothetical protein